jgi:hypothetical protein
MNYKKEVKALFLLILIHHFNLTFTIKPAFVFTINNAQFGNIFDICMSKDRFYALINSKGYVYPGSTYISYIGSHSTRNIAHKLNNDYFITDAGQLLNSSPAFNLSRNIQARDIAYNSAFNKLYYVDNAANKIGRYDLSTNTFNVFATPENAVRISTSIEGYVAYTTSGNTNLYLLKPETTDAAVIAFTIDTSSNLDTHELDPSNPDIAFSHMDNTGSPVIWNITQNSELVLIYREIGCTGTLCKYSIAEIGWLNNNYVKRITALPYNLPVFSKGHYYVTMMCPSITPYWDQKSFRCVVTCPDWSEINVTTKTCKYCHSIMQYALSKDGIYTCVNSCTSVGYLNDELAFRCYAYPQT